LFNKQKTTLIQCPLSKTGSYTIPSGVETICNSAFRDCANLSSVVFPNTVTSVGTWAFWKCTGLTGLLDLPPSMKILNGSSFQDCSGITSLSLPTSITTIANNAFDGCTGLKTVEIPTSLTTISSSTFWNCSALETVVIPSSITSIGRGAFFGCKALKSITANCAVPIDLSLVELVFDSVNVNNCTLNVPFGTSNLFANADKWKCFKNIIETEGLFATPSVIKLGAIAGEKVKINIASSIGWNVTSNQNWLSLTPTEGIAGKSDIHIATLSINNSGSLRTANVTLTATGFANQTISVSQYCKMEVVVTAGGLKKALEGKLDEISDLTIRGTIDASDFKTIRDNMSELVALDLSGATIVTYSGADGTKDPSSGVVNYQEDAVPASAFFKWSGIKLTTLVLPPSTKVIDEKAFQSCLFLKNFVLPSQLSTIEYSAFFNCSSLESLDIPSSVTKIGNSAFGSCTKLSKVTIPPSVTFIGSQSFYKCCGLTSIALPQSLTLIDGYAFQYCTGLKSIIIPALVNEVGYNAFDGCVNLTEAIFEGNAPNTFRTNVFKNTNNKFKILYHPIKTGFTSPLWKDYPCFPINDPPIVFAGTDQTVFENTLVILEGSATDPNGDSLTFKWNGPKNLVIECDSLSVASFKAPHVKTDTSFIFRLTIRDNMGNTVNDSVTINVEHKTRHTFVLDLKQPDALKIKNQQHTFTIRLDSSLVLSQQFAGVEGGTLPYAYQWKTPDWKTDSTQNSITANPRDTTLYQLLIRDKNGCSALAGFTVNVIHPLMVESVKTKAGCFGGEAGSIKLVVTKGAPPYSYNWSNGNSGSEIKNLKAGKYKVTVSDSDGQTFQNEFEITEFKQFQTTLATSVCYGESYILGDKKFAQSGNYSVKLTSKEGCDSIIDLTLTVNPEIKNSFEESICQGESFTFRNKTLYNTGLYTDTLVASTGCDSITSLHLTVNPLPEFPIITIKGDTLISSAKNNQWYETGLPVS